MLGKRRGKNKNIVFAKNEENRYIVNGIVMVGLFKEWVKKRLKFNSECYQLVNQPLLCDLPENHTITEKIYTSAYL